MEAVAAVAADRTRHTSADAAHVVSLAENREDGIQGCVVDVANPCSLGSGTVLGILVASVVRASGDSLEPGSKAFAGCNLQR